MNGAPLQKLWGWWKGVWKWLRWPAGIAAAIYIGLFLYGAYLHGEKDATEEAVAFINSQRLTMADVTGENLPPPPDAANTSLEGVDVNLNGIRDDVELAIFEMYPTAINIRAAELQYAKALQLELTKWVFNEDTLSAVIRQEGRAYFCVADTGPEISDPSLTQEEIEQRNAVGDARIKEVESLVFNTNERKERQQDVYKKYMTSYGAWEHPACDIDPDSL